MRIVRERPAGYTLVELLIVMAVILLLIAMIAMVAIDPVDTARQRSADAFIAKVSNALWRYKRDMRAIPMVNPLEDTLVRNAKLTRALTDPAAGWSKANRVDLRTHLSKRFVDIDGDGTKEECDILVDPWGRPFQYYSFKVEEAAYYSVAKDE